MFFSFSNLSFFCFPSHPYMPTKKFNGNSKGPQSRIPWSMGSWVPPMGTPGEIPVEAILCVIKRRCPKYPIPKVCHKTPGRSLPQGFVFKSNLWVSIVLTNTFFGNTFPKNHEFASENRPSQKGTIVFQPSIFSCAPLVSERILWKTDTCFWTMKCFFESILILYVWAICWWYWYP